MQDLRSFLPNFLAGIRVFFLSQTYITFFFGRVVSYIKNGWENNEASNRVLSISLDAPS